MKSVLNLNVCDFSYQLMLYKLLLTDPFIFIHDKVLNPEMICEKTPANSKC